MTPNDDAGANRLVTCPRCDGDGEIIIDRLEAAGAPVDLTKTCPLCDGRGEVPSVEALLARLSRADWTVELHADCARGEVLVDGHLAGAQAVTS